MWCVSHVHSLLQHTDSAVMMDDESLHSLCHRNSDIELDRFLAQLIPSVSGVVVPQFLIGPAPCHFEPFESTVSMGN